jgi:hypothetical protein
MQTSLRRTAYGAVTAAISNLLSDGVHAFFLVQRTAINIGFVIIIYTMRWKWFPSAIQHAPHITTLLTARRCFTDKTCIPLAEHYIPIFSSRIVYQPMCGTCVRNQADGN